MSVVLYSFYLNIFLIVFMFVALIFGRSAIWNGLKYAVFKRRGHVHFAYLDYGNKLHEFVAPAGGRVEFAGQSFVHNEKPAYRYDTGGNFYVAGQSQPINLGKFRQGVADVGFDSKRFETLAKRERALGKQEGQEEDKRLFWLVVAAAVLSGLGTVVSVIGVAGG